MTLNVTLPDGSTLAVDPGATTLDVAARLGARLHRDTIAGRVTVNGKTTTIDARHPLPDGCQLEILTRDDGSPQALEVLRHSTAHVMAEAICKLFPETRLVYGPPLEDGFYYDVDLDRSIRPEDFEKIEVEIGRIIKEDRPFVRHDVPREVAMEQLTAEGNRYKIDNARRADGDVLSFYVTGENRGVDFEDLCRGPHVPSTGAIGAFKIRQVSGSFYRGDVDDQRLQRVYGTAFFKRKSLEEHLKQLEEARKRDHRVLGKELGLFSISQEVGGGLVLWQPKGAIVRMLLERFLMGEMLKRGYQPVYSPNIGRLALYRTSGHYPYYEESQFPALYETDRGKVLLSLKHIAQRAMRQVGQKRAEAERALGHLVSVVQELWGKIEGLDPDRPLEELAEAAERELVKEEGFLLKPMNCPHHVHIYKAIPRSYRDLPVRLAEFGTVYRYEQSGELSGMIRVRGFTQDDAHLFCTPQQLEAEVATTVELTQLVLHTLEFRNYRVRLGLGDRDSDKYVGNTELWIQAEAVLRSIAERMGLDFTEEVGEAAFYGPKIDFLVRDCIGREWQLGTVQVDYNLPERFDLNYVGADNKHHRPIMIHRAPFGSMERFVGILIEHFAGAFPLWLAPVQVAVATISEKSERYGREVAAQCTESGLRCELDVSSDKIGPKKHRLRGMKIPYILVVGEQEATQGTVNINDRDGRTLGTYPLANFLDSCRMEIESKGTKDVPMHV
ncbi:MAG TPA: threonine--tRNA ligase [Phycisphaerae bacterium]|nr:threonine--tRNA ligase [Phycisphaerae bacterium]